MKLCSQDEKSIALSRSLGSISRILGSYQKEVFIRDRGNAFFHLKTNVARFRGNGLPEPNIEPLFFINSLFVEMPRLKILDLFQLLKYQLN